MYVPDLVGSAFIYNQMWHITAVLVLIIARLQGPSVVSALLNADPDDNGDEGGAPRPPLPALLPKGEHRASRANRSPLPLVPSGLHVRGRGLARGRRGLGRGIVGSYSQLVGLAERAQEWASLR
jgi:hypothetical protein